MNRVPNRKKMRREYLRQMIGGSIGIGALDVAFVIALLITVLFGIGTLIDLSRWMNQDFPNLFSAKAQNFTTCMAFGICSAKFTGFLRRRLIGLKQIVYSLDHIPPVTPSTLPVEEVLVRGAEEPTAPSETLLRATVKGEETKAEELLRVASGESRNKVQ